MQLKLHHVNLCSKDVPAMDEFYRSVLGLEPEPSLGDARLTAQGYSGSVAFLTDDIEAFKKRLEEKGVPYSDYGTWAMNGWHQIFFYDPEGNVIEVHQADD